MKVYRFFIFVFILVSFITRTIGGEDGLFSRIIVADIFGAIAIIFYLFFGKRLNASARINSGWILILFFGIGILGSYFPLKSSFEVIILAFLLVIFTTIVTHFKTEERFIQLVLAFAWASLIGSTVGLYDSFIGGHGLPRIFPERAQGEALSGFRNAGQAGAYMFITVAMLFSFNNSKLFYRLPLRTRNFLRVALFVSFLFFITTGKIAAYIGFLVSFFMYLIYKRNFRVLISSATVFAVIVLIVANLETISPLMYNRLVLRVKTRVLEPVEGKEGNVGTNFIKSNFGGALVAFGDNPLTASGIGGFLNRYGRYEVHSTYLKIIGETGLIGIFAYLLFMFYFLKMFYITRSVSKKNPYASFLRETAPLVFGLLVSWAYTYHLRKREFWIFYAIYFIAYQLMLQYEKKEKEAQLALKED